MKKDDSTLVQNPGAGSCGSEKYSCAELDRLKAKAARLATAFIRKLVVNSEILALDAVRCQAFLHKVLLFNPFIQLVIVTDINGKRLAHEIRQEDTASFASATRQLADDFSQCDWAIQPVKTGGIYVSDYYPSRFTHALIITVSSVFYNRQNLPAGIVALDIRYEDIIKMDVPDEKG